MTSPGTARSLELLSTLHTVLARPTLEVAGAFSAQLQSLIGHGALLILTPDSSGRPQHRAGRPGVIDTVSRTELDAVLRMLSTGISDPWGQQAVIGGVERPIVARTATTGALLVLTDPELTPAGAQDPESTLAVVDGLWQLVALSLQQRMPAPGPAARARSDRDGAAAAEPATDTDTDPATARGAGPADPEWGLSPREQEVFALVASGARNKAIAADLAISVNTVKFHVANLLRKLGASTRAELAALAR